MGLFALWGTMQLATGPITPVIFLAAMVVTLPTAISYAVLNSRFPSAGAASSWLWAAIGPAAGFQAGLLMTTYFLMATFSCPVLFAMFFADLSRMLHLPISHLSALYAGVLVSTVPVGFSCLRGAEASVRLTVRLMLAESIVVLALSATILAVQFTRLGGISLSPFNPRNATYGTQGFLAAMIVGIVGFCGFDVVSTAAEEANAPREHLPRAIFITIVGIALFWAANAWAFTLAIPPAQVDEYTTAGVPAVTAIAENYWGWGSLTVILTAFTGTTAVYLSCIQGSSRIVFALARHGLLPSVLGQVTGKESVPRNAIIGVLIGAVLMDFLTLFFLKNGLNSVNWWSFSVVFFASLTFMAVNIANTAYFFRFARAEFGFFRNLLVPIVGFAVNGYLLYAAFFSALWSSNLSIGKSVIIGCIAILVVESAVVICVRLFAPHMLDHGAPISVDG
jgi:amino acid transporter